MSQDQATLITTTTLDRMPPLRSMGEVYMLRNKETKSYVMDHLADAGLVPFIAHNLVTIRAWYSAQPDPDQARAEHEIVMPDMWGLDQ